MAWSIVSLARIWGGKCDLFWKESTFPKPSCQDVTTLLFMALSLGLQVIFHSLINIVHSPV